MAYSPTIDFLALLRQTSGGVRTERMPGLDYVVAALARMGLFQISVAATAPTINQPSTVWIKPSLPSWVAEGYVFLWNASAQEYETATPALWTALLTGTSPGYFFQSADAAANVITPGTSLLAVQRVGPAATTLTLPTVAAQGGKALQIADWSSGVTNHAITLSPAAGALIMRLPSWTLFSTPDQLAGVTLYPSTDLNGWVIAP